MVMEHLSYLDFEISISKEDSQYIAKVKSPAGDAACVFKLPFTEETDRLKLELLLIKLRHIRSSTRRAYTEEMKAARKLGGKLFRSLFGGDIAPCFRKSLNEIYQNDSTGLRVKLNLQDVPEIADLPWEFLFDTEEDRFLAPSNRTPIVRHITMSQQIQPIPVALPLRLLVAISSPAGYPSLDSEREKSLLGKALAPLEEKGRIQIRWLEEATQSAIHQSLIEETFHVFHFLGHGVFDKDAEEGKLVMHDGFLMEAYRIGMLMHDHRSLRLAVLNSCEGGRISPKDLFSGVAPTLVRQGIPAVVAMQTEITDNAAITFSKWFYTALINGFPVDAAVAEARKAIFFMPNDVEWGTPVLYTRSKDGVLFRFSEETVAEQPEPESVEVAEEELPEPAAESVPDPPEPDRRQTEPVIKIAEEEPTDEETPDPERRQTEPVIEVAEEELADEETPEPERQQTEPVIEVAEEEKPAENGKEKAPVKTKTSPERFTNSLGMEFVYIHPGTFMMGAGNSSHKVTLTRGFYMQTTQVTQRQWKLLMGNNPSYFFKDGGYKYPVEGVSWNDVQEFLKKLNEKEDTAPYRLPTEAEWEYSCRAGSSTRYCFGDDENQLAEYACYNGVKPHSVGEKKSNIWGLYDMHGNVWEWCHDWYGNYPTGPVIDPTGSGKGLKRVKRGGSYRLAAKICRSANRGNYSPGDRNFDLGFRLAFSPN
jgi:formylglycine-generating enzyme required for sulfatase activity